MVLDAYASGHLDIPGASRLACFRENHAANRRGRPAGRPQPGACRGPNGGRGGVGAGSPGAAAVPPASSSPVGVVPAARRPGDAILLLRETTSLPGHCFWPDDTSIARSRWVAAERLVGHGQVTDAHLAALCLERKGRLVTFDGGIAEVLPEGVDAGTVLTVLQR